MTQGISRCPHCHKAQSFPYIGGDILVCMECGRALPKPILTVNGKPISSFPDKGGTLIIVGDHPEAGEEFLDATEHTMGIDFPEIMVVNNAYRRIDPHWHVDYLATCHSSACGTCPEFPASSIPEEAEVWGLNTCGAETEYVDHILDYEPRGGTSAIFATIVGLSLGYSRIILCGVHLDEEPYNDPGHLAGWRAWAPLFRGRVFPTYQHVNALIYGEEQ